MKKILFVMMLFLGAYIYSNAQPTKAVPIANGCGTASGKAIGAAGMVADYVVYGKSFEAQTESCNQHDRDYYHGKTEEDRNKADKDFGDRGDHIKATATSYFGRSAYEEAQKSKKRSQELQPAWEQRNQMCLDEQNYKIVE